MARAERALIKLGFGPTPRGKTVDAELQMCDADLDLAIIAIFWLERSRYAPAKKDGKPIGVCGLEFEHTWVTQAKPSRGGSL